MECGLKKELDIKLGGVKTIHKIRRSFYFGHDVQTEKLPKHAAVQIT